MHMNLYLLSALSLAMYEGYLTEAETKQLKIHVKRLIDRMEGNRKEAHHG